MASVNTEGVRPEDVVRHPDWLSVKPYARSIKCPDAVFIPNISGCEGCMFLKDNKKHGWCEMHPCQRGQWRTAIEAAMHKLENA
jgi:hypothetical protein